MTNQQTTFLFVTNNRCPDSDFDRNPLTWAVNTLEANSEKVSKYLFVVDGSTDYTLENIEYLKNKFKLDAQVIQNSKRMGCSYSRKIGIEALETEMFFMGDDDCIYSENFIKSNLFAFKYISENVDEKISVLQVPIFENDIAFRDSANQFEIGKTYFELAWFFHNFDKQVSDFEKIIPNSTFKYPIKIDTFKGVTLSKKTPIIESGNFIDLSEWSTDYSEHIDLSYKLKNNGYTFYYFPDISASCTHLRFGDSKNILRDELKDTKFPGIKLDFGEINKISVDSARGGCRVDDLTFIHDRIGLFLAFFITVSLDSAYYFAMTEYENLVIKSHKGTFLPPIDLPLEKRKKLWDDSITRGINFAKIQNENFDAKSFKSSLYSKLNI